MANSNHSSSKKTPAKRQPARSKTAQAEQQRLEVQKKEEQERIIGIVVFALSLLFFFIAVVSGEGVWNHIHTFYIGVFGWMAAVILPLLCLLCAFIVPMKKQQGIPVFEMVAVAVLVLLLATFIHVVTHDNHAPFVETFKSAYHMATMNFNGGFVGAVFGGLLLTMGKAPAIILTAILFLVDVMLLWKVTVSQFFRKTAQPVKKALEKATPYIEERKEQRRMRMIDIPLDEEVIAEKGKKETPRKSKTKTAPIEDDGLGNDGMADIIREINASTKRNQEQRQQPQSLDDIVKKAIEEKPENPAEKAQAASAEFTVTHEEMLAGVPEYRLPPLDLLKLAKHKSEKDVSEMLKNNGESLVDTLASFGVAAQITDISRGPTVTRYELKPAAGVRISKITNLADDIALNLAATNVRIEAPIPGKAAVGIEIPNTVKNMVTMRELIDNSEFQAQKSLLSVGLGKDIAGNNVFCDVAKMPHLLIAGTTGSGKSVCMNSIIVSMLYRAKPDEVKLLMIDPKKVEFSKYENIPHLLVPVVTDPRKASGALGWAVSEMLKRYQAFSDTGVRDIAGYNKFVKKHPDMEPMPKIVICIDELADLMMAAPKEVEDSICRLAQMARAAGMHLVIATQRPSVDVITGLIKANISSRIALTVSSQIDSRTIIDTGGAEKLLGNGDMLYAPIGVSKPRRVQGCYISDEEVEALCDFIKHQGESQYSDEIQKEIESKAVQEKGSPFTDGEEGGEVLDPLFEKAVDVVLESGRASTSFLQRKLGVGYSRGSKIMDQLEEKGIIGAQDGAKPREIRINRQQWIQMQAAGPAAEFTAENTEQMQFEIDDEQAPAEEYEDI